MSELRSVVEQLRTEVLAELPDARLEEDLCELHRSIERLQAERLRRLAELDRRRLHERDGHLSAASWVVSRLGVGWGRARRSVRVARALEHMPRTRRALEEGELSLHAAELLAEARRAEPEAFERSKERLVRAAQACPVAELHALLAHWRQAAERERFGKDRCFERRRLHASPSFLGMVRVDGDLDPEGGETLLTALRAVVDAGLRSGEGDHRTPAQRRADALVEICRQWLDRSDRPTVGGERPHVTLTVDVEALRADGPAEAAEVEPGGRVRGPGPARCELDHVGPVGPELAKMLACDASVMRVVLGGRSEPLDVGRRTPVVPPALRRAVIVRDRGCRFPGCDRPHTWCDAHHVIHWAKGGPTALPNLVLLCRRHHRLVHHGFTVELVGGRAVFRRPDGSILEDRAPP